MFEQKTYGVIYCLTSPSGKRYFGKTTGLFIRMRDYRLLRCSKQPKILNALRKYGWDKFIVEVISECHSEEELNFMEKWFIALYDSMNKGYNCQPGGEGGPISEFTKRRMSEVRKGVKLSEAIREKRRIAKEEKELLRLKEKGPIVRSKETRESISKKLKGVPLTEERKISMKNGHKSLLESGHDYKLKQKPLSEEHKEKLKNAFQGKTFSEDRKIHLRQAAREERKNKVYLFSNARLKEEFLGTPWELSKKYGIQYGRVNEIVTGRNHRGGWFIKPQDSIVPTAPEQNQETN